MTSEILNKNSLDDLKTRQLKYISTSYKTVGDGDKEKSDAFIVIGSFSPNVSLRSIKLSSDGALAGCTVDLVLLNGDKEEISYKLGEEDKTITPIKSGISLATALTAGEQLPLALKLKTLEKYITDDSSAFKSYRGQLYLALKIKTAPTTATADVNLLAEVDFIEKI